MHRIALRGVGILVFVALLATLTGCAGPIFRVKVVNEGDYSLTSVRLIPYLEDAEEQAQAFADAVNLMPCDAEGNTLPLESEKIALLPHLLEGKVYYVEIKYHVDGEYIEQQYESLLDLTEIEENALEALNRLSITPIQSPIRGGTDGSRLSYMGLPTPNLFAGGHNFHAVTEYVAIQDMEMATKTIVEICQIWEEKA